MQEQALGEYSALSLHSVDHHDREDDQTKGLVGTEAQQYMSGGKGPDTKRPALAILGSLQSNERLEDVGQLAHEEDDESEGGEDSSESGSED